MGGSPVGRVQEPESYGHWGSNGEDPGPGQTADPWSCSVVGPGGTLVLPVPEALWLVWRTTSRLGLPYLWKGEQLTE